MPENEAPAPLAPEEPAAPAAEKVEPARGPDFDQIVATWFNEHVANSEVSRHVGAINHMTATAVPALLDMLKKG